MFFFLRVLDVNDNNPKFELEEYQGVIDEEAAVGTSVLYVRAIDPDFGDNSRYLSIYLSIYLTIYLT